MSPAATTPASAGASPAPSSCPIPAATMRAISCRKTPGPGWLPTSTGSSVRESTGTEAAEVFAGHRDLLFSIVYNMLGTVGDTEDVLQETWLAWSGRDLSTIDNLRAYLVRIA